MKEPSVRKPFICCILGQVIGLLASTKFRLHQVPVQLRFMTFPFEEDASTIMPPPI